MTKPRLLIFTEWFLPGVRAGGPIRSIANLVDLLANDLDISIITSNRDFGAANAYENLPSDEWVQADHGVRVWYSTSERRTRNDWKKLIAETEPTCIYLNSMFSPRFTLAPLRQACADRYPGRIVFAPRGMLNAGALKIKWLKKRLFLSAFRATGIASRLVFHATNDAEAHTISAHGLASLKSIAMVPNVPEKPAPSVSLVEKQPGMLRLLFLSRVVSNKNLLFLLCVLKQLQPSLDCTLTIAGPIEDMAYWGQCLRAIDEFPSNVRTNVKGEVPHVEINRLVESQHALILPTAGENFGHAIYEVLACGRPVIISDQTPWNDLHTIGVGWDLALSDTDSWIEAVSIVGHMKQGEFDKMCLRSHQFAMSHFKADELRSQYLSLFTGNDHPFAKPT